MHLERTETYRVPPERLWPLVANTDSINREVRLPSVEYEFSPLAQGGTKVTARARSGGITLEWVENPFEWVWPRKYSIRRDFTRGPFREFVSAMEMTPEAGGTRLSAVVDLVPKGFFGRLAGALAKRQALALFDLVATFERYLLGGCNSPYPRRYGRAIVSPGEIDRAVSRLKKMPVDGALAERLARFIAEEVEERVRDLRPFQIADEWGVDRMAMLRLCLWATQAGLLDLRWHIICPACLGSKGEHAELKALTHQHACDSCNLAFRMSLENTVEARFTPNRAVRETGRQRWCFGGPMNTPHILAQIHLKPGESRVESLPFPPGRYGLRRAGSAEASMLTVRAGAGDAEVAVAAGLAAPAELGPGGRLTLRNTLDGPIRVAIEAARIPNAATASVVTSIQEFRDLFAHDALAPGLELSIGSLAILFSDLKGSTAMYDRIGDAPAYAVVRKHFEYMTGKIRRRDGAVIKTMGDAVMAVFRSTADALRCALEIQRDWEHRDVAIKLGLHAGPSIAVSAADQLDYFGSTVNIAARAQAQSIGGDIVVTDAVMQAPGVTEALRDGDARETPFSASLKGFETAFTLHRIVLEGATEVRPYRGPS